MGKIKNIFIFDFGLCFFKLRVIFRAVYMIAAEMDYVFVRKTKEFFGEWLERNYLPKLLSVFKGMV